MKKEKKAFKDTLFGKIVGKAGNILTDVPGIVLKAASGNYLGAVADVMGQFGKSSNPQAKELLTELTVQMKKIELEFSKVELEETKVYLLDTQNARNREVEMANSGKSDWFMSLVGIFVLLSFMAVVYVALLIDVKDENLFYFIAGNVFTMAMSVVGYFFGSSKGSKDKTNLLAK